MKVPIESTSTVLTIPASYRNKVGSKTGNPVFVRVVTYNDTTRYRSKVAFGFPTPPAVNGDASSIVSVASANIQGVRASENFPNLTWMDRRKQATAAIARTGASVVAVQEASTAPVNGTRHYLDVAHLLAPSGYKLAYKSSVVGTAGTGVMKGAQLYYRPSDLEVLDSGLKSTKKVAARYSPTTKWLNASGGQETDRYFAWALMRSRTSHVKFYIVSVHLQVGQATNNVRVRTAVALGIHEYMVAKAKAAHLSTAPLIVAGDWNTDVEKHPGGPTTQYIGLGYQDAAASAKTTNRQYSSTNDQDTRRTTGTRRSRSRTRTSAPASTTSWSAGEPGRSRTTTCSCCARTARSTLVTRARTTTSRLRASACADAHGSHDVGLSAWAPAASRRL